MVNLNASEWTFLFGHCVYFEWLVTHPDLVSCIFSLLIIYQTAFWQDYIKQFKNYIW